MAINSFPGKHNQRTHTAPYSAVLLFDGKTGSYYIDNVNATIDNINLFYWLRGGSFA